MINVYICEEDPVMMKGIKRMLKKVASNCDLDICTKGFDSGTKMISAYNKDREVVNLVCLNTELKGESGIQIGRELRDAGYNGEIVYISEDEKEVLNTFEVKAYAYLVKGKKLYADFKETFLNLTKKLVQKPNQCLLCSKTGMVKRIPLKDIKYIEIDGRTSKIHHKSEISEISVGLSVLETQLEDKHFVRVNRSLIINVNYIKERSNRTITLLNEEEVVIGERYYKVVKNKLSDSFWEPCYLAC